MLDDLHSTMSSASPPATPQTEPRFFAWLSALSNVTGLGRPSNTTSLDHAEDIKRMQKEEKDWDQCEKWKAYAMQWGQFLSLIFSLSSSLCCCVSGEWTC